VGEPSSALLGVPESGLGEGRALADLGCLGSCSLGKFKTKINVRSGEWVRGWVMF
jgi:hypothetical protein